MPKAKKPKPLSAPLVKNIYTADPSAHVFEGKIYIYPSHDIDAGVPEDDFGGPWGGQLQRWQTGKCVKKVKSPFDLEPADNKPALCPKVARLTENMLEFAEKPRDVVIVDKAGKPLVAGDHARRFFEASWLH